MIPNVRRVLIALVTFTLLMVSLTVPVLGAKGGNSTASKACENGGYVNWTKANGSTFKNEGDCTKYAAMGGTLVAAAHVFARAFSNVDGIPGFNPATDVLVAELIDWNGNEALDAGDIVRTDRYPTNLAMTTFGSFGVTSHAVVSVGTATPSRIVVTSTTGGFEWRTPPSGTEAYAEAMTANDSLHAYFIDGRGGGSIPDFCNIIDVTLGSPSQPAAAAAETACGDSSDQPFVDVTITLATP
jgi:hypothetical protein